MHIKHLHCMIEELAGGLKENVTTCMQPEEVGIVGAAVDMLKDLCEAEYYARISKAMEEQEKEDEEEEKYLLKRLKEEYGEEEGERRYYDDYRYKRSGRFAPRGKGSYSPRRGYDEMIPMDYRMDIDDYKQYPPEHWRDLDRKMGRLYYTETGMNNVNRSGMDRTSTMRGGSNESRVERARRGYVETKEMHKDGTQESKQYRMKELDTYMNELNEDMKELIKDMTPEERTMLKQKIAKLGTLV